MSWSVRISLLMFFWLALLGCNKESVECTEEQPCGFGETCQEGVCVGSTCATSAQCGMEQYCNSGTCSEGCEGNEDCYPGDACNSETATCETATCTNSHVDCAFKEYCNSVTGDCYDASGYFCQSCQADEDCGGGGNMCLSFGFERDFCGVYCEAESDCPSGFTCVSISDGVGNVVSQQCITYCWLYEDGRPIPPGEPGLAPTIREKNPTCIME